MTREPARPERRWPPSERLPSNRFPPAAARPRPRDRGQASVEFLGFLPVLLVVVLAAVQLGLAGYVAAQARTGARAAARTATRAEPAADPVAAGHASMSDWVARRAEIGVSPDGADAVSATVRVPVPSVIPGITLFGPAEKTATMPRDEPAP
ncbi:TadE/TadG family type IV pilus assembly protein [Streptomyces sp. NPDC001922]|uniref:TadE/TadG family type IV pilus assembly protein n=1 Tax=Streptomyces sp. NPDC001922 TaxID=3364624 RepID=UPI0036B18DEF